MLFSRRFARIHTLIASLALTLTATMAWGAASASTPAAGAGRTATAGASDTATAARSEERATELAARFFDPLLADAKDDTAKAGILHQRGVLYLRSFCRAQAVADFDAAVQLLPKNHEERYDLLFHRACAYLLLPTPDANAALADIAVCLAAQPNDTEALIVRAEACRRLGRIALADADLARAVLLAPKGDAAIRALLQNAQNTIL